MTPEDTTSSAVGESREIGIAGAPGVTDPARAKRDIVLGVLFALLALFALVEGTHMPVKTLHNAKWYTAPAFLPMLLSTVLLGMAALLIVKSIRIGGGIRGGDIAAALTYLRSASFLRLVLAAATLTVYIFVLLGNMPYKWATFIYLFGTMVLYSDKRTAGSIFLMFAVSAGVAWAVGYGFSELARIPMP